MTKKLWLCLVVMMLIGGQILPAQAGKEDIACTTGEFMKIPQGARAVGMGGAFVGIADDITATYWNPAGLIQLKGKEVLVAHTSWFEDIKSEYFSYSLPIKPINNRKRVMGGSMNFMRVGGIQGTNGDGQQSGILDVGNLALTLSLGFELSKQTSFGANLKAIKQNHGGYKGEGIAIDLGVLLHFSDSFSFGATVQNAGPKLKTQTAKNGLPLTAKVGLGYKPAWLGEKSIIGLDLELPKDNELNVHAGMEYWVNEMLAVRLGFEDQTGFSAGFGFKSKGEGAFEGVSVQTDYAFLSFSETGFDNTHRFSVITKF